MKTIKSLKASPVTDTPPADRLLEAVQAAWPPLGRANMTARQISQTAEVQTSQINYYFGNFEQLLASAQAQSMIAAQIWCDRQLSQTDGLPAIAPEGFGAMMAALIDDWTVTQRPHAFAWRECQMMAARDDTFAPLARQWRDIWKAFWDDMCARMGFGAYADITRQFFDGESFLHRITWRRALDRACLTETCQGWARLLTTSRAGDGALRHFARLESEKLTTPIIAHGSIAEQIAEAAAMIVGRFGAAAVTHRAVARESGVNLGAVTYHFPTSDTLMHAAWINIYLRLTRNVVRDENEPYTHQQFKDNLIHFVQKPALVEDLLGMEELMSASARADDLNGVGAMIRYSRGRSTYHGLSRMISPLGPLGAQDAALISNWTQGLRRDLMVLPADEALSGAHHTIDQIVALLRVE
ncbi:TetR family transcriptional regulator [Asticcacaulis machinosus]|uniref:TetR family transcriptional regulator n=1 Tax=Asticcacaulis machinosus TaxID=2984211 RepID=A0ABT5HLS9_9CAUL|nr:TetR family transcriptional regulator [Asticcacaulis machinosus]MDC7677190.1 TetR family transcriptional regulator [Asticcacaulis machinosus]